MNNILIKIEKMMPVDKKTGKISPHRLTKKNSLLKLINYTLK